MRAWKAILLFLPVVGVAVFCVYLGIVMGRLIILFSTGVLAGVLGLFPPTSETRMKLLAVAVVTVTIFGLIFAHLSAIRVTGKPRSVRLIVKGMWMCFVAGMTTGITLLLPFPTDLVAILDDPDRFGRWVSGLEIDVLVMLPIGVGIMLYYFFAACRKHTEGGG